MDYSDNPPVEQVFVVRMANCIRVYNAINNPPRFHELSDILRPQFEKELQQFSEERKQLEQTIRDKYNLDPTAYKKIINDLYVKMNAADIGYTVTDKSNQMYARISEFIDEFTAAVKALSEKNYIFDGAIAKYQLTEVCA